jgi:hypothetical protein
MRRPPAHFIHVGKTGGTAIKWALTPFATAGAYDLRLHKHDTILSDVAAGERFFFVIRDPIGRFVSGFYSRQRKGGPRFDVPWSPGEAQAFEAFSTPDALARSLDASDPELRRLARNSMRDIGHVRGSYWQWFGDPHYFSARTRDVLAILWLPSLEQSFPSLCERLGLGGEIRLPADDVDAHRNPPTVDRRLGERAQINLRRWYWAEFEFVRTCMRHPMLINLAAV